MQAISIIRQVAEVLQDQSNVTWTEAQLIQWLNDAQRTVALVRPDASAVTGLLSLAAGTKQSLPANGLRLLALIRNMGAGADPGPAVRLVDRGTLDTVSPNWHSATPVKVIKEYSLDDRDLLRYWVNPPADGTTKLEGTYAVSPAGVTATTSDIALADTYAPALVEWMLYRCFLRDSEQTPNFQRAAGHFQNFFNLLGLKMQADMASSPKVRAHLA